MLVILAFDTLPYRQIFFWYLTFPPNMFPSFTDIPIYWVYVVCVCGVVSSTIGNTYIHSGLCSHLYYTVMFIDVHFYTFFESLLITKILFLIRVED